MGHPRFSVEKDGAPANESIPGIGEDDPPNKTVGAGIPLPIALPEGPRG